MTLSQLDKQSQGSFGHDKHLPCNDSDEAEVDDGGMTFSNARLLTSNHPHTDKKPRTEKKSHEYESRAAALHAQQKGIKTSYLKEGSN